MRKPTQTPQALAEDIATRYFQALASALPNDAPPGEIDLSEATGSIFEVLCEQSRRDSPHADESTHEYLSAVQAGYLVGVAIGRRMGGAR